MRINEFASRLSSYIEPPNLAIVEACGLIGAVYSDLITRANIFSEISEKLHLTDREKILFEATIMQTGAFTDQILGSCLRGYCLGQIFGGVCVPLVTRSIKHIANTLSSEGFFRSIGPNIGD